MRKSLGALLIFFGWVAGLALIVVPLVWAIQSSGFVATLKESWVLWATGILLFIVLTEVGKYLRRKETQDTRVNHD